MNGTRLQRLPGDANGVMRTINKLDYVQQHRLAGQCAWLERRVHHIAPHLSWAVGTCARIRSSTSSGRSWALLWVREGCMPFT